MFSSIMPKDYIKTLNKKNWQKVPYEKRFLSGMVFIALTKSFTSLVSSEAQTNQLCDGQATRTTWRVLKAMPERNLLETSAR